MYRNSPGNWRVQVYYKIDNLYFTLDKIHLEDNIWTREFIVQIYQRNYVFLTASDWQNQR